MITVAIPLADATPHNAIELRYSLRSLEAVYGKFELLIVGSINPVKKMLGYFDFLPCSDKPGSTEKENNIRRKFYYTLSLISSPFLWSNDDFFVNSTWSHEVTLAKGWLTGTYNDCKSAGYRFSIQNTIKHIGHDWYDFDTHAPIWVDPAQVKVVDDWPQYGYLHKTLYMFRTKKSYYNNAFYVDLKLRQRPTAETLKFASSLMYFSTSHAALSKPFIKWLDERWPHKSRFEL